MFVKLMPPTATLQCSSRVLNFHVIENLALDFI